MTGESIRRIAIVGAGQAGGEAARVLRGAGFAGAIVLIGEERHPPYERPPLSKAVLTGAAPAESVRLFSDAALAALTLDFRPGVRVERLEPDAGRLVLADGDAVDFDRVILATGGRARRIDMAGSAAGTVRTLRSLEDSLALAGALRAARRALVIGGGWIGLEVASSARTLGVEVVLVEAQARLCARVAPPAVSDWLLRLHTAHGVRVELNETVQRLDRRDGRLRASLGNGETFDIDVALAGVGMIANDELARAAGLACDGGILTDACGRTAHPAVFACGDVAAFAPPGVKRPMRLESWANARVQAAACARAVLGQPAEYGDVPWFWSDQHGANVQMLGFPPADGEPIRRGDPSDESFSLFWLDGKRLNAAVAVNAANDIKVAKRLMARGLPADARRLADSATPLRALLG